MKLNDIRPGRRRRARRVGRGIGSGSGKTCGRGHKGQRSRSGGCVANGFEGGQMPLHRRLPKTGFACHLGRVTAELRLGALAGLDSPVTPELLRRAGLVSQRARRVRIIAGGSPGKPLVLSSRMHISRGARADLEAAGGSVQEEMSS